MCHVTVMMNLFHLSQKITVLNLLNTKNIVLFQNEESNSILLVEELNFCFFACCSGLVGHEKYWLKSGMILVVIFLPGKLKYVSSPLSPFQYCLSTKGDFLAY